MSLRSQRSQGSSVSRTSRTPKTKEPDAPGLLRSGSVTSDNVRGGLATTAPTDDVLTDKEIRAFVQPNSEYTELTGHTTDPDAGALYAEPVLQDQRQSDGVDAPKAPPRSKRGEKYGQGAYADETTVTLDVPDDTLSSAPTDDRFESEIVYETAALPPDDPTALYTPVVKGEDGAISAFAVGTFNSETDMDETITIGGGPHNSVKGDGPVDGQQVAPEPPPRIIREDSGIRRHVSSSSRSDSFSSLTSHDDHKPLISTGKKSKAEKAEAKEAESEINAKVSKKKSHNVFKKMHKAIKATAQAGRDWSKTLDDSIEGATSKENGVKPLKQLKALLEVAVANENGDYGSDIHEGREAIKEKIESVITESFEAVSAADSEGNYKTPKAKQELLTKLVKLYADLSHDSDLSEVKGLEDTVKASLQSKLSDASFSVSELEKAIDDNVTWSTERSYFSELVISLTAAPTGEFQNEDGINEALSLAVKVDKPFDFFESQLTRDPNFKASSFLEELPPKVILKVTSQLNRANASTGRTVRKSTSESLKKELESPVVAGKLKRYESFQKLSSQLTLTASSSKKTAHVKMFLKDVVGDTDCKTKDELAAVKSELEETIQILKQGDKSYLSNAGRVPKGASSVMNKVLSKLNEAISTAQESKPEPDKAKKRKLEVKKERRKKPMSKSKTVVSPGTHSTALSRLSGAPPSSRGPKRPGQKLENPRKVKRGKTQFVKPSATSQNSWSDPDSFSDPFLLSSTPSDLGRATLRAGGRTEDEADSHFQQETIFKPRSAFSREPRSETPRIVSPAPTRFQFGKGNGAPPSIQGSYYRPLNQQSNVVYPQAMRMYPQAMPMRMYPQAMPMQMYPPVMPMLQQLPTQMFYQPGPQVGPYPQQPGQINIVPTSFT